MKTSKKALALALAAAMAFTGIPVTDAEAASTAKLSATKATIYVGGSKTVSVKAPSTWKSVAISTVSSNKKSVATVKKASSKSFKVTAVKAGTAKVTVKVSYKTSSKKNAKKYTKTLAFTANVKSTTLTAKPGKSTLYIGETTKVTAKAVPSSAKITYATGDKKIATVDSKGNIKAVKAGKVTIAAYAKYGTKKVRKAFTITVKEPVITLSADKDTVVIDDTVKVTAETTPSSAKVTYSSSDESIATVDADGTVTGVKAGTVTITGSIKVGSKTIEAQKELEVVNAIKAAPKTTKKIDVTFAGEIEKIDKADVTVTDANGAKVLIKSATLDTTKKIVTVEFYSALTSGTSYKVAVKVGEKTYEDSVNYVKGTVTKIVAANQFVKAGTPSDVKYTVYDENGLDITADTRVTFTGTVQVVGGKVTLADKVVAYLTAVYTNPTTGAQIKSEQFTVTGQTSAVASFDAVTVSTGGINSKDDWPKEAVTSVAKSDSGKHVFFKYTDQYGNVSVTSAGATSLNPEILIVDAKDGTLTPVKEGTATVSVKDGDVSKTFTITVTADPKPSSLAVDASSKLTTSLTKNGKELTKATVKVNVLDQNGNKLNVTPTIKLTLTDGASVVSNSGNALIVTTAATGYVTGNAGTAVDLTPNKEGTAWFEVKITDAGYESVPAIYVAITVTKADQNIAGYKLDVAKEYDLNDAKKAGTVTNSTIGLYAVNAAGEKVTNATDEVVSGATISLKDAAGNEYIGQVTSPESGTATTYGTITRKKIQANGSDNKLSVTTESGIVYLVEGTYTLTASKNGVVLDSVTLNVVDTSEKPAVSVKNQSYTATSERVALSDIFDYDSNKVSVILESATSNNTKVIANVSGGSLSYIAVPGNGSATLYNVKLKVTVTSTGREYLYDFSSTPITITK